MAADRSGPLLLFQNLQYLRRGVLLLDPVWTKNRKAGTQPLPHDLVLRLKAFADAGMAKKLYQTHSRRGKRRRERRHPSRPLLYVSTHTSRVLAQDLEAAGIPKWTPEGKIDFQAARVTYISSIIEAGATVKEAKVLARHCVPDLTMNVYAKVRDWRLGELTEKVAVAAACAGPRVGCVHRKAAGAEGYTPNCGHDMD